MNRKCSAEVCRQYPTVNGRDIDIVDEMNKIVSEINDVQKALQTRPIKIGNKVCYVLDGVCEVYIDPLSGELIEVKSCIQGGK